jgi:hypothetical protein
VAQRPSRNRFYSGLAADLVNLRADEQPPAELFHYTSATGLLEIIQSNHIWATNLEFMNDLLEVKYAKELFLHLVQKEKRSVRHKAAAQFLEDTANTLYPFTALFSFYGVSFCADGGDRLSQWRAYAREGSGYSIGFRAAELLRLVKLHRSGRRNQQIELIRVVYERQQQESIVRDAIRKVCQYIMDHRSQSGWRESAQALKRLPRLLCIHLFPYVFSFKTSGFQEENEWRLVTWLPAASESQTVRFRASANFIIPYLSLDLLTGSGSKTAMLPIATVIQGPRVETDAGMKSLELLLRKYGHSKARVVSSTIPLRYVS